MISTIKTLNVILEMILVMVMGLLFIMPRTITNFLLVLAGLLVAYIGDQVCATYLRRHKHKPYLRFKKTW